MQWSESDHDRKRHPPDHTAGRLHGLHGIRSRPPAPVVPHGPGPRRGLPRRVRHGNPERVQHGGEVDRPEACGPGYGCRGGFACASVRAFARGCAFCDAAACRVAAVGVQCAVRFGWVVALGFSGVVGWAWWSQAVGVGWGGCVFGCGVFVIRSGCGFARPVVGSVVGSAGGSGLGFLLVSGVGSVVVCAVCAVTVTVAVAVAVAVVVCVCVVGLGLGGDRECRGWAALCAGRVGQGADLPVDAGPGGSCQGPRGDSRGRRFRGDHPPAGRAPPARVLTCMS
jgi:hypothetical protein